jgi:tetratricopeptide (TPR) repeat protein
MPGSNVLIHMTRPFWLLCVALSATLGACAEGTREPIAPARDRASASQLRASIVDLRRLAKTDDCVGCHRDVASHWASSVHAYASFDNPWYRVSVDAFRSERGENESRFCAGCHDPLLLLSGGIDEPIEAENPLAYAGITCLVCHGTEAVTADGNASLSLAPTEALIPDPASASEIAAHRKALSLEPLRTAALCGSCHRSFSGPEMGNENHLPGIEDFGDWASSAYAGAVQDHLISRDLATCQDCHMPVEPASDGELAGSRDAEVRSHRWAASHSALAAQLPDRTYADRARSTLQGSILLDIGPVVAGSRRYVLPREAMLEGGETLQFDVVLENLRVGHRFPGGVRDLQDSWVEVTLGDASGRVLGVSERRKDDGGDVFVLRATVLDADARPERLHRVHRFAAAAFDQTLGAHQARTVRYSIELPKNLELPLRIDARLLHRKHSPEFQALACEASRSVRGLEFAAGAVARAKIAIDPCVDEPVTSIGTATAWLGEGAMLESARGGAARPDVERLLRHSRALLAGPQEAAHLAKPSLERAMRLASKPRDSEMIAQAWLLRARLSAREGRADEAIGFIRRAESLAGRLPVFDRVRGDALAQVWRWSEALESYRRVVDASPSDPGAWKNLARAYGSLGDDENALRAAEAGLVFAPRDEALLRSRALALRSLGHADAEHASRQWLAHRTPDEQSALLSRCERAYESCGRDRQPIPDYTLVPPTKAFHASIDSR